MKKRILSLVLTTLMVVSSLAGCGGNTNQDETNKPNTETEVNTEMDSETEISTETKKKITCNKCGWYTDSFETDFCHGCGNRDLTVTENGTETEVSNSDVDLENFFKDAYSLKFPTGMTGFTDKYVFSSDETWSLNDTHYVDANGNVMDFEWEGPTELGEKAGDNDNSLNLQGGNYELFAWTYGYADGDYELCLDIDKDTWTTYTISNVAYVENGYYNVDTTDTTIRVIFEVEGAGYKGYTSCITDSVNKICYQFAYLEKIENYDANRAMKVIESIKFWNYQPTNE